MANCSAGATRRWCAPNSTARATFYRLRVHRLQSRSEAESLCSRLKARGTACYFGRAEG
jgi:hypothetical protein